ncbi:MAG: GMC family oxidoreductase [Acidobacteria bacterium]|nr:GMC family oxidoreductase [Acidobacteriota bacterium]
MITFQPSELVDFVVIGSGAAGGVVAKELSTAGFSVVVLEQGAYVKEKDFTHDELAVNYQHTIANNSKLQPNTFRTNDSETAKVEQRYTYGRLVGGGSVHFTANYWRFHPDDFRERSVFGDVPGSSFADWPVTYDELEPYYTRAEWELGISGLAGANPFEGPRSKPYPLPPLPVKSSGVLFERATKKLGLHPFPAPMAVLSQPYRGRGACAHCGWCETFGCEMRAKSSTLASVIPMAEKTGRCEIRSNCYVRRIQSNDAGRVTGAIYFDAQRREVFQRARAVVLSANGVESAKLLLMSPSKRFPHGLANSSGMVGKNFMWDLGAFVSGLFEHPLNEYKSVQVSRVIHDYYAADPKRGFYGGAGIDARFNWFPISFGLDGLPPDGPQWGSEYKRMLGHYFNHTCSTLSHTTSLPVEKNQVDLDPSVKDAWGLPVPRITFQLHPDDRKNLEWTRQRQVEILQAAGATQIWSYPLDDIGVSAHLMGTMRMGNDPARSVVNRFNRAHDVPNLFIVDGSSLVTSGRQQPTATIQALAYRAAEAAVTAAKKGEL